MRLTGRHTLPNSAGAGSKRFSLGGGLLITAGLLSACASATRPPDTALYLMVLETTRRELSLPQDLAIHPLLAQWSPDTDLYGPLTDFNAFDTLSVRAIVNSDPAYSVCTPSVAGSCREGTEKVAVVLSALRDIGRNSIAVRVMVTDRRAGQHFQRHYFARITNSLTGWSVVEFREVPKSSK